MSIQDQLCVACGHPVEVDDAYCASCGNVLAGAARHGMQTWPEPPPPDTLRMHQAPDFVPLPIPGVERRRRLPGLRPVLAVAATVACVGLLGLSEVMLRDRGNEDLWVVMWLVWYAATVAVAVGWAIVAVQWSQRNRGLRQNGIFGAQVGRASQSAPRSVSVVSGATAQSAAGS